jgi:membrane protein YqaA with SNARE-associated domain
VAEAERTAEQPVAPEEGEVRRVLLRGTVSIVVALALVMIASAHLRPELEAVAADLIRRFGLAGLALGSFAADAIHFPVPPQFYLFMAVSGRCHQGPAVALICLASMAGGVVAYGLGVHLGRLRLVRRWFRYTEERFTGWLRRYRLWAVVLATFGPIPFSTLCNTAGFYRMPYRLFAWLVVLRVPRLLVFYLLIRLGWG